MEQYEVDFKINDGKSEAPPYVVDTTDLDTVINDLFNDYDQPFGVGCTLTIKRIK